MRVLRALRERRHHGIRFFQQAAVLAVSCLVSNELLKISEQRYQYLTHASDAGTSVHIVCQCCHLEDGLVLLNPLQRLLEAGVDAAYRRACRVCAGLCFLSVLLQRNERKGLKF